MQRQLARLRLQVFFLTTTMYKAEVNPNQPDPSAAAVKGEPRLDLNRLIYMLTVITVMLEALAVAASILGIAITLLVQS